ncbi:MAG: hypothetical protein K0R75_447, partial [Paenibacillaceae bacterium]|nr:hypothetical protein [Paenibacillaceae bacterium]
MKRNFATALILMLTIALAVGCGKDTASPPSGQATGQS